MARCSYFERVAGVCCNHCDNLFFTWCENLRFSVAIGWTALNGPGKYTLTFWRGHIYFHYIVALIWVIKLLEGYDRGAFRS